ncbi:hypothetical protein [Streptomyces sp. NPDC007856]|uniref:hypothetical protein n=1 Tax=Streptomyces sp. NPDC007856 TaxID=3364781 RepID=UPI0036A3CBEC
MTTTTPAGAGGLGEPLGHEPAQTLVATARAVGAQQPEDLSVDSEVEHLARTGSCPTAWTSRPAEDPLGV